MARHQSVFKCMQQVKVQEMSRVRVIVHTFHHSWRNQGSERQTVTVTLLVSDEAGARLTAAAAEKIWE